MANPVDNAIQDLVTRINALPEVQDKTLYVFTQEKLLTDLEGVEFPAVGVIYSGMVKVGEQKQGRTQMLSADVVLTMGDLCQTTFGEADEKPAATELLDKIRNQIIAECSPAPGGHKWWFQFEVPAYLTITRTTSTDTAKEKAQILMYVQRWSTRVIVGIGAVTATT
jgi:hypothetical protein